MPLIRLQSFLVLILLLPILSIAQVGIISAGPQLQQMRAPLTVAETEFLANKKRISMCVDPDWMPMERISDQRHEGIASDFIAIFQRALGIPIDLVITENWQQSLDFARQRQCDILSLAMATPERLEYMNFTQPYLSLPLVLATRQEHSFVSDVTLLTEQPLGIVAGYAFSELLRQRYPSLDIRDVVNLHTGLTLVEQGKLYGMIDTLASIGYMVQHGFPELKIAGKFNDYWELGIAVRNDEPLLLSAFEKAVTAADARLSQQIINRWISVRYDRGIDIELIGKLLIAVALVVTFLLYRQYLLKRYNRQLLDLAEIDALTQVASRRRIDQWLDQYLANFHRYGDKGNVHCFSIIMLDLDHFKQVNDQYGHLVGDQTLVEFCRRITSRLRKVDLLGRWGGEEFIILCPNTGLTQALVLAEQLRQSIADTPFEAVGQQTASFGVTEVRHSDNTSAMVVSRADAALYLAKSRGRNQVVASE
jgi:polar amino acid transport system substrate-binding protein